VLLETSALVGIALAAAVLFAVASFVMGRRAKRVITGLIGQQMTTVQSRPLYRTALDNGVDRLYHYQRFNAEHMEHTLANGVVRFSRPSDFNDPWDCRPVFSVPENKGERATLVKWMAAASTKHGTVFNPDERARRVEQLIAKPDLLRRLMDEAAPEMQRQMDERYRVYCLTTKPACPLMWAHYADHHCGICLEINVRQPDLCAAIQVQYRDTYPTFRLDDNRDLSPFYTKSREWHYEDEYRLVAEEKKGAFDPRTLKTEDQFYTLPPGSLMSIIIGARAPEETRRTIRDIVHRSGHNLLIRQARRSPDRYELVIDPPIGSERTDTAPVITDPGRENG
jgi:hypothetical protein